MENDITFPLGIQVPEPSDLAPYLGKGIDLPTFGGRMSVQWDPNARVTSVAGLAHFGTFLANAGLFDRMAEDAPFDYTSNNACPKRDILGTAVLAILLGKTRYVHINELRHDETARQLLGLNEIVSEDTIRPAFLHIMGRIVESGRKCTIHLTSTHAENAFIRKALDTVAAFFNWLNSTAPHLNPDKRWRVVVHYAFRLLLLPDPALRELLPIR